METLLSKANQLLRKGLYEEAISIYKSINDSHLKSSGIVDFNIKLAESRRSRTEGRVNGVLISDNQFHPLFAFLNSKGLDAFYVINLEKRFDRKLRVSREFSRIGINPIFVKGVDANFDADAKRRFFNYKLKEVGASVFTDHIKIDVLKKMQRYVHLGAFGYNLSQKKVFKDAIRCGHRKICVFDDDVFFTDQFKEKLCESLSSIAENYKVIMLGASEYSFQDNPRFNKEISGKLTYPPIPGRTLGSFGAIYDASVFQEIIDGIDSNLGTFDNVVLGHIFKKYPNSCHVLNPNVCIPVVEESDIREGAREQIEHGKKMNWDVRNFTNYKREMTFNLVLTSAPQVLEVKSLKLDFLNVARVSFYYFSIDGLRPVIHGHDVQEKEYLDSDIINIHDKGIEDIKSVCGNLDYADYTFILNPKIRLDINSLKAALEHSFKLKFEPDCISLDKYHVIRDFGRKSSPLLSSVIIPVYRGLDNCWASIESALKLEGDVEVIVVNDNPSNTDFKRKLNQRIQEVETQAAVKVIEHKKRRGASGARNTGFLNSSGEFISFLDDDDLFLPSRIVNASNRLKNAGGKIGSAYCGFSGGGHAEGGNERFKSGNLLVDIVSVSYKQHYINTDTHTFKRSALLKINGFNETYFRHQDVELNTRFFEHYETIAIESYDVVVRPERQEPTFEPSYENVLLLKEKYLSDFKSEFSKLRKEDVEKVVENHARDVVKHRRGQSEDELKYLMERFNTILGRDSITLCKTWLERALSSVDLVPDALVEIDATLRHRLCNFSSVDANFDKETFNVRKEKMLSSKSNLLKQCERLGDVERLRYVFDRATGVELNAINLLIANVQRRSAGGMRRYIYFMNRYLAQFRFDMVRLKHVDAARNVFAAFSGLVVNKYPVHEELISVIMPAFNNRETVEYAIDSILNQTHKNIEVILVDDCSDDGTYDFCVKISEKDSRVKCIRNDANSGAYVSRNRGLELASGDFVTVLDADDWSFPNRLSYQLSKIKESGRKAHIGYYLRVDELGCVGNFRVVNEFSYDGVLHKCLATLMVERKFFIENLGCWDSVRFGADSELYSRMKAIDPDCVREDVVPLILALDRKESLTKSKSIGVGSEVRAIYAEAYSQYHKKFRSKIPKMEFPQVVRPFEVPEIMI